MDPKPYLDYLDKEMTIMGILSAFSVAAPAGILVTVMGKDGHVAATLWNEAQLFLIFGSFFCILAASLFYKERSNLAFLYGQISLVQTRGGDTKELDTWFKRADRWDTWCPYFCAFTFLLTGFVEYALAVTFFAVPLHWNWLAEHLHTVKIVTFFLCPLIAFPFSALQCRVRIKYKDEDKVWREFWRSLTKTKGEPK